LKKSLTDTGDKMSESEFDEMCREAGVHKSGKIEYEGKD
jgi:Ca2+-binding EF-hand superfamily protein